jgi:hypothetical protein
VPEAPVPVSIRAASTGASSGDRISKGLPAGAGTGGALNRRTPPARWYSVTRGRSSPGGESSQRNPKPTTRSSGPRQLSRTRTTSPPAGSPETPRNALVLRTLTRCSTPSGSSPIASAKVPPVSTQIRQAGWRETSSLKDCGEGGKEGGSGSPTRPAWGREANFPCSGPMPFLSCGSARLSPGVPTRARDVRPTLPA